MSRKIEIDLGDKLTKSLVDFLENFQVLEMDIINTIGRNDSSLYEALKVAHNHFLDLSMSVENLLSECPSDIR